MPPADALTRARLSLEGLAVGDTFGEQFFDVPAAALQRIHARQLPPAPWSYTDDTEMALSVYDALQHDGTIDQDALGRRFAARMDPARGYGAGAFRILDGIREGGHWRILSRGAFNGMGSFGNGAAMRVGPLGGYFATSDLARISDEARRSAEVTHAHDEGIAGAIAVAVACALAWRQRDDAGPLGRDWLVAVRDAVPTGYTREGIDEALALDRDTHPALAGQTLGNGASVSAPDTVPFCLWIAAYYEDFEEALWSTVEALGDRDTTCAIVGSILALHVGESGIPEVWRRAKETLPVSDTAD